MVDLLFRLSVIYSDLTNNDLAELSSGLFDSTTALVSM